MPILHDPLFPEWPDACSPDRFRLKAIEFEATHEEGQIVLTGTYTNHFAVSWRPQRFLVRVAGSDGDRVKAFAEGMRVWFEAFEITDDMRESVRQLGDPPEGIERRRPEREGEDLTLSVSVKRIEDDHERAYVFGTIDPDIDTVNRHERHDYERPSNGTAGSRSIAIPPNCRA